MRAKSILWTLLLILPFLIPCSAAAQPTRGDMIVSTEWLAERLDGRIIVIDVAEKDDYDSGHIPSARLLEKDALLVEVDGLRDEVPPVSDFERTMTGLGVGERTRIVLYSRNPLLAVRAWFTLDYFGHGHRASVLNGGFGRWTSEGRAITKDVPVFEPAAFAAQPNEVAMTRLKVMTLLVRQRGSLGGSLVVVDARPETSYRGEVAGAGVHRAGHIPGAINIPWRRHLDGSADNALFRNDDELRALYAKVGITRGTTIIAYCRTGMEASMNYFVLRYLGYDPSLFDGSYVEWALAGTPVA